MDKVTSAAPRLRLASDIDLTKANPLCQSCKGTGQAGIKRIPNPENQFKNLDVPIICRCVSRGGGVKKDAMDDILLLAEKQLESGIFGSQLASDIKLLPKEAREHAIAQLKEQMKDDTKDKRLFKALKEALAELEGDKKNVNVPRK